jgi:hypothetical protein
MSAKRWVLVIRVSINGVGRGAAKHTNVCLLSTSIKEVVQWLVSAWSLYNCVVASDGCV